MQRATLQASHNMHPACAACKGCCVLTAGVCTACTATPRRPLAPCCCATRRAPTIRCWPAAGTSTGMHVEACKEGPQGRLGSSAAARAASRRRHKRVTAGAPVRKACCPARRWMLLRAGGLQGGAKASGGWSAWPHRAGGLAPANPPMQSMQPIPCGAAGAGRLGLQEPGHHHSLHSELELVPQPRRVARQCWLPAMRVQRTPTCHARTARQKRSLRIWVICRAPRSLPQSSIAQQRCRRPPQVAGGRRS